MNRPQVNQDKFFLFCLKTGKLYKIFDSCLSDSLLVGAFYSERWGHVFLTDSFSSWKNENDKNEKKTSSFQECREAFSWDIWNFIFQEGPCAFFVHSTPPFQWEWRNEEFFEYFCLKSHHSITVFGGSFNPWHDGHQISVENFLKQEQMPLVVMVDSNPQKEVLAPQVNFERYQKIFKSLSSLYLQKNSLLRIHAGALGLSTSTPTYKWVQTLPSSLELSILIGDDQLLNLMTWKEIDYLCERWKKIYISPRYFTSDQIRELAESYRKAKITEKKVFPEYSILPEHPYQQLSSTKLRPFQKK